jgi:hypothetical protein
MSKRTEGIEVVKTRTKKNKGVRQPWGMEMEEVGSRGTWQC